jgi:hypothetical protein
MTVSTSDDLVRNAVCRALDCRPEQLLRDVRDGSPDRRRLILYRDRLERVVAELDALVAREVARTLEGRHRGR